MDFVRYCIMVSLYPLAAIVVCGLAVWGCKELFMNLLGHSGYRAVMATSIIGTPVHELGHAGMCLLFRHKILKLVLWDPHPSDGTLGYVRYARTSNSLYQKLGGLFISAGPIFSGMAALSIVLAIFFPNTWNLYVSTIRALAQDPGSVSELLDTGLHVIWNLFEELGSSSGKIWFRIPALLVMLSIALHTSLSPGDVKIALSVLPLYFLVTLVVAVVTYLPGSAARALVLDSLGTYHAFMMAMFTVVLIFVAFQVLLALVIHGIQSCLRK